MKPLELVLCQALEAYQAGDPAAALRALDSLPGADPLPESPTWLATDLVRRAADPGAPATVSAAVRDWIDLARDRLRRDLGEDVISVVSVPLALGTALGLIRRDAYVQVKDGRVVDVTGADE